MSRGDYERLIIRPAIARQRVQAQLQSQVPARADQIHAQHILVATKDAADAVETRLQNGEDFAAVAKEVSTDTSTAGNGGDLGWFPKGIMVAPFENAAFALDAGQVSDPVQSSFGWHVIKVLEKEPDRPLTLSTLQTLKNNAYTKWLDTQRGASKITAKISLTSTTDTTTDTTFQAPPDAPQPPVPTAVPTVAVPTFEPESTVTGSPAP
jgi:parvulin-like peptidyl-prolyl isomerase